jgi:hypothetical protein
MAAKFKDKSDAAPAEKTTKKVPISIASPESVDRLAELLKWEQSFKQDERYKELEALKKALATEADKIANPASVHVFEGVDYEVEYSSKPESTSINEGAMPKIHKMLKEGFYAIATISKKNLDDYLNPQQRAEVTTTERTGTRRCVEYRERGVVAGTVGAKLKSGADADL